MHHPVLTPEVYRPRHSTTSPLRGLLERFFPQFRADYAAHYAERYGPWRPVIDQTVHDYLACGDLQHGFSRVRCPRCRHEFFVAFSCRRRCLCPSCHQKRALLTGARLAETVCAPVPHRQFVFTIPRNLRGYFRRDRALLRELPRLAWETVREVYGEYAGPAAVPRLRLAGLTSARRHDKIPAVCGRYARELQLRAKKRAKGDGTMPNVSPVDTRNANQIGTALGGDPAAKFLTPFPPNFPPYSPLPIQSLKSKFLSVKLLEVLMSLCLLFCSVQMAWAGEPNFSVDSQKVAGYKVSTVHVATTKATEYRVFYEGKHFLSVIKDKNGGLAIRPHPGDDPNGWGSTWYPEAFLPGATLRKSVVSVKASKTNTVVKASGIVSKGTKDSFGNWTMSLAFTFDQATKQISANGTYEIKLNNYLSDTNGDLNICKIASNYLTAIPLLDGTIGDTGDMEYVEVSEDCGSYLWIPPDNPGFFPQDPITDLTINVAGQYNNVDTVAQGFSAIAPAYKPSLKLSYSLQLPEGSDILGGLFPLPLLSENFTKSSMDKKIWRIPTWLSSNDGTYLGRTQIRCSQNAKLPTVKNGNARIQLDTYNPTGFSFYGTELISKQSISVGQGVLVTVVAKADTPFPRGVVGGIFLYALDENSDTIHNEIDFEIMGNRPYQIQTNIYGNENLGAGHPVFCYLPSGTITDYHKYQILWLPNQVLWFIDDILVETDINMSPLPTGPMYLHINMWAPSSDWAEAYDASIQPTGKSTNKTYTLLVDSIKIENLEESPMIFGAIYDTSCSKLFYSDNVGITPLILRSTMLKNFKFNVEFQSETLPDDQ